MSQVLPLLRTLAAAATKYSLFDKDTPVFGYSALLKVRSLGGGTYIAVGNAETQIFRMSSVGSVYTISPDIPGEVNDLNTYFLLTDGTNATVEVNARIR